MIDIQIKLTENEKQCLCNVKVSDVDLAKSIVYLDITKEKLLKRFQDLNYKE